MQLRWLVVLVGHGLLGACGSGEPPPPDFPHALCGMAAYDLLSSARTGRLVAYEPITALDLQPPEVDAYSEMAGAGSLIPAAYGGTTYRYRYTTQDRGQVVEATALFAHPSNAPLPDTPRPLLLYTHGTVGFSDPCAPSQDLLWSAFAPVIAGQGFVVVAPDYIGMNGMGAAATVPHPYLIGESTAIASWDALRAGEELLRELGRPVTASRRTVIAGASQGGHAALLAELYAPYYAPEYDVAAVAAIVPPSSLALEMAYALTSWQPVTDLVGAMFVAQRAWYGQPADLGGVFTAVAPDNFATTLGGRYFDPTTCYAAAPLGEHQVSDVYVAAFADPVAAGQLETLDPWGCYARENSLATSSVAPARFVPTLMAYGERDEYVPTASMRTDFQRLCDLGYRLEYSECSGTKHVETAFAVLGDSLRWATARLDGAAPDPAAVCTVQPPHCCTDTPTTICAP